MSDRPPSNPSDQSTPTPPTSDRLSATPPPTEQDLRKNYPGLPTAPPSFSQFALQNLPSVSSASLEPQESILSTEIQEITADEFDRSIGAAEQQALAILALKLPRSCKRKAQDLAFSIRRSRQSGSSCILMIHQFNALQLTTHLLPTEWEQTGIVPDDEDIRIAQPTSPSTTAVSMGKPFHKRPPIKQGPKEKSVKVVNLLDKTPASASTSLAPIMTPQTTLAGLPPTNSLDKDQFSWEDVVPAGAEPSFRAALGNQQPNAVADKTSQNLRLARPDDDPSQVTLPGDATANQTSGEPQSLPLPTAEHGPTPAASGPSNSTTTHTDQRPTESSEQTATSPLPHLTIIKSDQIRAQVVSITQEWAGSKPSWSKYVATWNSLSHLLENCAQGLHNPPLAAPSFQLGRISCSYSSWIQTITSLANEFLSPSHQEQWYCPDLLDFPLLTEFGNKNNDLAPGSFIPPFKRTQHPESTLVRCLYRLHYPPQYVTAEWAKVVAASVELMAGSFFIPPPINSQPTDDHVTRGVEALCYLDTLKNSSSTFDPPSDQSNRSLQPNQRMHSVDLLHDFRNVIIDVLMAYIIMQTHSLSEAPLTAAQKKANTRANQASTNNSDKQLSPTEPDPSALTQFPEAAVQKLQKYQNKQNFQPLVYFILAGVRGLFITSRDHRIAGVLTCMSFIQAISIIKQHSSTSHTCKETIWRSLSALLVKMLAPVFQSPDKLCSLASVQVPTRYQLAQAITTDFLNHWNTLKPTSPFLMPHTPHQITRK
ncbi:hypothetical protein PtB15_2B161 [Puccinia triticina]|nr:hypothetical protein PtB15_2B161 [Puccinia triticina]